MTGPKSWISALAATALITSGCGVPGAEPGPTTTSQSNLGDRLPVQLLDESFGHHPQPLTGILGHEPSGCWVLHMGDGPRLIVFPGGFTTPESDASTILGRDGEVFTDGLEVDALGGIITSQTLPGGPDGSWANYVAFCDPEREEVVVVDTLELSVDPTELSEEELLDLLQTTSLTESWGCGFGFTTTSEDQRVGVQLYPNQMQPTPGPVIFPHGDWTAQVLVGKHLAVNHCDDVIEGWEPEQVIAAQWPLASGTLSFDLPAEPECGLAGTVTATLEDASIETDSGERQPLMRLTVVNDSFGCFAG